MNLVEFSHAFKERSHLVEGVVKECQLFLKGSGANDARLYLSSRLSPQSIIDWEVGFSPSNHLLFNSKIFQLGYWYWKGDRDDDRTHQTPISILQHHPIVFPYRDRYGHYVGLCGRSISTKEEMKELQIQKYKYTQDLDKSHYCYGLHRARDSIVEKGYCLVVEGQIDCISCHSVGLTNTVAVGGSSLSEDQFRQLRMWTDRIIFLFDPDAAGRKGTIKAMERFGEDCQIQQIQLPEGYDIDSLLKDNQLDLSDPIASIKEMHGKKESE